LAAFFLETGGLRAGAGLCASFLTGFFGFGTVFFLGLVFAAIHHSTQIL